MTISISLPAGASILWLVLGFALCLFFLAAYTAIVESIREDARSGGSHE